MIPGILIGLNEVRVEGGEGVPGRADHDAREGEVGDGARLYRRGDRAFLPALETLTDDQAGSDEAREHNGDPEHFEQFSLGQNMSDAVNTGGLENFLKTFHPSGDTQ